MYDIYIYMCINVYIYDISKFNSAHIHTNYNLYLDFAM